MLDLLYRAAGALRRRAMRGDAGRAGEDLAHRYLRRRGCVVVARNYRPPGGHNGCLVFVEVKTRSVADYGTPDRAVDPEKQSRVERAARDYARRASVDWEKSRFDIVAVVLGKPPQIEWTQNAWRGR